MPEMPSNQAHRRAASWCPLAALLAVTLLWSYWPTLVELWQFWHRSGDYSVGRLVPLVAAYLIWSDRRNLRGFATRANWWGLGVFAAAQGVRFVGIYYDYVSLERYSLILTVVGLCLLLFGAVVLRRMQWVFLFLLLMVPLPGRLHNAVALPLQELAARSAVFLLELLSFWVVREGNTIQFGENTRVAVAEACNGLRMLTAFVFVAATLAFLVQRSQRQKVIVVMSSVPIAVVANVIRLAVTVILIDSTSNTLAEQFFHDFTGLAMMPLAVMLLVLELWLLRWFSSEPRHATSARSARELPRKTVGTQG